MTPGAADALASASRLLTYPDAQYAADLDALGASLEAWHPEAARDLAGFAARIGRPIGGCAGAERGAEGSAMTSTALQELFTQTFDLNPTCALEVGWHLFGEEYERGAFLVRMRQALREHGVDEGGELPDHLAAMLRLVTKLDPDEADLLIANALIPAIDKMLDPLEKSESPFLPLMKAIRLVLAASRTAADGGERRGAPGPPQATRLAGCRGPRHSGEEVLHG